MVPKNELQPRIEAPSERVFLVENGMLPPSVLADIRNDLEVNEPEFQWNNFLASAGKEWEDYIPSGKIFEVEPPSPEELASLKWSDLVPEDLRDEAKVSFRIQEAWKIWKRSLKLDHPLYPHIVIDGTMGAGKSNLAEALFEKRPFDTKYYAESWQGNAHLPLFYDQLRVYLNESNKLSEHYEGVVELFHKIQGATQGWFAARKFIQYIVSMPDLRESFGLQDTSSGQDAVYERTHVEMEMASEANKVKYDRDNRLRRKILPPPLLDSIHVFAFTTFEHDKERIKESRKREIEMGVPDEYYYTLYKNSAQRMIAVAQRVPIVVVDADVDFRPGSLERAMVAEETWNAIDVLRNKKNSLLFR